MEKMKEMSKMKFGLIVIICLSLLLSACQAAAPATDAVAATAVTAATAVSATVAAPAATDSTAATVDGCLGAADTALVDLDCREVTIAVENVYLPFNYIELSTGKAGGWDYDIFNEICTLLHCKPVFVETGWDGLIQSVADGLNNIGGDGITITDDRSKIVDFSTGYIKLQQRLLVLKGETRFDSMDAFAANKDLILGAQSSTTNYETAIKFVSEDRIKAYEQVPFAVQSLLSGDVDAVILDEIVGLGYQGQDADKLDLIGPSISSDELGFAFTKGSDLVDPVNKALDELRKNGKLEALNLKYFGPDFNLTYDQIQQ